MHPQYTFDDSIYSATRWNEVCGPTWWRALAINAWSNLTVDNTTTMHYFRQTLNFAMQQQNVVSCVGRKSAGSACTTADSKLCSHQCDKVNSDGESNRCMFSPSRFESILVYLSQLRA